MFKKFKLSILIFGLLIIFPISVFAHSGRTDSSGCHTNKKTGDYHCHGGSSVSKEARTEARGSANLQARESAPIFVPAPEITRPIINQLFLVTQVVDGDTIKVNLNGKSETLRLIGIDTPEIVDPRKPVQCFAKEASNKAKEILNNQEILLEADDSQGERDKYDRLLRYIFLKDGTNFNKLMIAEGYAHEYTYQSNPYKYQAEFKEAEKTAREAGKGLWGPSTCNGDTAQTDKVENNPIIPNPAETLGEPQVKKSTSDICHEKGSAYYKRTANFQPYSSIEECLNSGGRLPK